MEKTISLINTGYTKSRELYSPDCEMSTMILDLLAVTRKREFLIFDDIVLIHKYGWKIKYKGEQSRRLKILDAEYTGK